MSTTKWDNHPDNTLLRINDFVSKDATTTKPAQLGLVRFGRSTWLNMVKAGKAPSHHTKDDANTFWLLGDIHAWLKAQGDPTELLAEIDIDGVLSKMSNFDALLAMVHAPNVESISFKKAGHRGALTMIISHRQRKVSKETCLWVAPRP
jgi:hypothetical protein